MRLLVIDDDREVRESLCEALREVGHDAHEAGDGNEALAWLAREPHPDAILLDVLMPRLNGQQFLALLRADAALQHIPVVVVSATVPGLYSARGADAALGKPVSLLQLLEVLARIEHRGAGAAGGSGAR